MAYLQTRVSGEIRQRIVTSAAQNSRHQSPADAVSDALLDAALNVRVISLDDWKSIIFAAFDATRDEREGATYQVLSTEY